MSHNQRLIRERLGKLGLGTRREEEIIRELSEHLADHSAALDACGVAPEVATREVLDSVSNWPELREEILRAETEETTMNYRTKVLWQPALVALTLSNTLLLLVQVFGPPPHFYWFYIGKSVEAYYVFIIPWLVSQPVVGAVAAYLSRRAGGTMRHQLLAALAPAIGLLGLFMLILPFAMIEGKHMTHSFHLVALSVLVVTWVLLPALPLVLGAAPFLRRSKSRQSPVLSCQ